MLRFGGKTLGFAGAQLSSASKGETVADTARVVSNYADVIAMRHPKRVPRSGRRCTHECPSSMQVTADTPTPPRP